MYIKRLSGVENQDIATIHFKTILTRLGPNKNLKTPIVKLVQSCHLKSLVLQLIIQCDYKMYL